jgi:hypothetical protein
MTPQRASTGLRVQAKNFPAFAFGNDLQRAAADFAIRREPLERYAGVNRQLELLSAVRTLDGLGCFHAANVVAPRQKRKATDLK